MATSTIEYSEKRIVAKGSVSITTTNGTAWERVCMTDSLPAGTYEISACANWAGTKPTGLKIFGFASSGTAETDNNTLGETDNTTYGNIHRLNLMVVRGSESKFSFWTKDAGTNTTKSVTYVIRRIDL